MMLWVRIPLGLPSHNTKRKTNMAKLIIEGLTPVQARELANWYEGQGEQDAGIWFECNGEGEDAPLADVGREGGCMITDAESGDVVLYCRPSRT
jgi:hypothetical protein